MVRPLGPLFETKEAKRRTDYIGSMCTITTGRVDKEFGQATIEDGADVLVVDVRCDAADNKLARNQQAMIIDFDDERLAYIVETVEQ